MLLPSATASLIARFEQEGRAAARVRHPNVVDVSDVGVEAGIAFLVMEFLEGEDLSRVLRREGPLSLARAAEIMLPVLGAVEEAHAQGVVHRDLKPENIFLARLGDGSIVPKVLAFGISKMAPSGGGPALTGTGLMTVATPAGPLAPSWEERRRGQRVGLMLAAAMLLALAGALALRRPHPDEDAATGEGTRAGASTAPEARVGSLWATTAGGTSSASPRARAPDVTRVGRRAEGDRLPGAQSPLSGRRAPLASTAPR